MKKLIIIFGLILSLGIFGCEYECNCNNDPLQNIEIGEMHDYFFENDIEINWTGNAQIWLYENLTYIPDENDYWQLPEETYNLKTGDCEDYCIMFMYLLKTKLNIETSLVMIENQNGDDHVLVYPVPIGQDKTLMYYEAVNNFLSENILEGWKIKHIIPFFEVMWMTYNYHDNVGKYR